jgi:ubiquinone/menaquinone biosynthesis C-methylase UbiE
MTEANSRSRTVESTFNRAADSYRTGPAESWEITARGTLEAAQLRPGESVLDVCCGAGTTALPAAEAVAPGGHVIGVDLSEGMLSMARAEQAERGLTNVEFEVADMTKLSYPPENFDAVICQLGIFFVDDPQAQTARLWNLVKPGGRLVLATIYKNDETQLIRVFRQAVRDEDPELIPDSSPTSPQGRTRDVEPMRQLMIDAGVSNPTVSVARNLIPFDSPEDYWQTRVGSGARGVLDQLDAAAAERVRDKVFTWIRETGATDWEWNLIYTVAHK